MKVSKSYQVSKSFLDAIKTKKPGKPGTDKRVPASARSLPGLSEFLLALKANPSFLKAPIGYEVVTDHSGVEQGESYKIEEKSHYLKENRNGHFVLSYYDGSESPTFTLHENQRIEDVEQEMISQEAIKSFTKVSATTFIMNFDLYEASCQMTLDLTKSSQLQGFSCKDNSGVTLNEAKIISAKLVKPQDYRSVLESIKLEVPF